MSDGRNLNPMVVEQPSRQAAEFEKHRFKKELQFKNAIDESDEEKIDAYEIFDMLRYINDPEHPLTLEKLMVIKPELITIDEVTNLVRVEFTPTIPNCSMATLIGLMISVKLQRCLPSRFKVDVFIEKNKHDSEVDINKQLNDKERVLAALENPGLITMVNKGLY